MEGQRLILNDGTIIEDGSAGYADEFLWLYLQGYSMTQAAFLFLNADKTWKIVYQYGDMEKTYEGFTVCTYIQMDDENTLSVCMKRADR